MATVTKQLADEIVDGNGYYSSDPRVMRVIEYDNRWGGISYGIEYQRDLGRYAPSQFVLNPRVYWRAM